MSEDRKHNEKFNKLLKGKTIKSCSYVTENEATMWGWYKRPLIIEFTDGSILMPQSDDEGNDGGAMYFQDKDKGQVIYVI